MAYSLKITCDALLISNRLKILLKNIQDVIKHETLAMVCNMYCPKYGDKRLFCKLTTEQEISSYHYPNSNISLSWDFE